jgi:hypothetical protein
LSELVPLVSCETHLSREAGNCQSNLGTPGPPTRTLNAVLLIGKTLERNSNPRWSILVAVDNNVPLVRLNNYRAKEGNRENWRASALSASLLLIKYATSSLSSR